MRTIEWEMPYWNWGHTFDYAEMAYLMVPRPFMVERGHLDLVGRDQWVAHEYAKVRFLYAQLGLADRTEIEFFQGGHSINGQGTFDVPAQAPALADDRAAAIMRYLAETLTAVLRCARSSSRTPAQSNGEA